MITFTDLRSLKHLVVFLALGGSLLAHAAQKDVWGRSPTASDDRFSNPSKPLYAGPDGWWNTGEIRAQLNDAAKTAYAFKSSFGLISNEFMAVGGPGKLQVVQFDFAENGLPKPGEYKVGSQGSLKNGTVKISFADTANGKIREWLSADNAGVLSVKMVNGFLYFTARNLALQSNLKVLGSGNSPKTTMTLGFEGAMSPSEIQSYDKK